MVSITMKGIKKSYGNHHVIHDLDLHIDSGEFVVLVGPSGCGKSTLLRMIAGLEDITDGVLKFGSSIINNLTPSERNIAMVFQDYALYPHMSVEDNMAFGLKMRGSGESNISERIQRVAGTLKIKDYLNRKPAQLSGGQRQRVAMGRAIVREPNAFLFDEPLSNLDAALRVEMRLEIAKLHKSIRATTIYVTHDQVEAMTLADSIVVMNRGAIEQQGCPMEIYRNPSSLFVAQFIGSPTMNAVPALIRKNKDQGFKLEYLERKHELSNTLKLINNTEQVVLGIRPEDMQLCPPEEAWFSGELVVVERLGGQTFGYLEIGQPKMLTIELGRNSNLKVGELVHVKANKKAIHFFDHQSGARISVI